MKISNAIKRRTSGDYVIFLILTVLTLIIAVPFYCAVVISLETSAAYARNPAALFPGEFTLENYAYLFKGGAIWSGYANTLFIAGFGLIWGMGVSVMMAYAFSREGLPGKKLFFIYMLFTMFFGGGLVPTYLLMKDLGFINSRWGIILMGGVSAYNIIIMKGGFESTPASLTEAALLDGANDLQIFFHVMLPLQKPLLATFSLFTVVGYWNSWYWPMILLNKANTQPLQLVLRSICNQFADMAMTTSTSSMISENSFAQGLKMAAVIVTMLPVMLVYPFLQKHFAKGVLVGAIKM